MVVKNGIQNTINIMKKVIIYGFALVSAAFAFSSCNKDYKCVCTLNGLETNNYDVRAMSKNKAEDECNERKSSLGLEHECKIQ